MQLSKQPHCQCPHHKDKKIRADHPDFGGPVVDHNKPHKGNLKLFWATNNLQSMTKQCHDRFKRSQERGGAGFLRGCDEQGIPLSGEHYWNDKS